jgi:hypothetical protein|tara:strand:- start:1162 stop:1344 length:183 start_codon:yes stop_codon:yes gene_type:complete
MIIMITCPSRKMRMLERARVLTHIQKLVVKEERKFGSAPAVLKFFVRQEVAAALGLSKSW